MESKELKLEVRVRLMKQNEVRMPELGSKGENKDKSTKCVLHIVQAVHVLYLSYKEKACICRRPNLILFWDTTLLFIPQKE